MDEWILTGENEKKEKIEDYKYVGSQFALWNQANQIGELLNN